VGKIAKNQSVGVYFSFSFYATQYIETNKSVKVVGFNREFRCSILFISESTKQFLYVVDNMALYFECQINKNALLQTVFFF